MHTTEARPEHMSAVKHYCRVHGVEHDDSYTGEQELSILEHEPWATNPTVLLIDDAGSLAGVASVMLSRETVSEGRGRFRIFHATIPEFNYYHAMLEGLAPHVRGRGLYMFVPEGCDDVLSILSRLGFCVERYSYGLRRDDRPNELVELPEGFRLSEFRPGADEQPWCDVVNSAFAHLAGHTECTPQSVTRWLHDGNAMPRGMLMLWDDRGEKPQITGVVMTVVSEEDGTQVAEIGPVAVMPSCQGLGLGRALLRAAITAGYDAGLCSSWLSVNAENSPALGLYASEGVVVRQRVVCMALAAERLAEYDR